MSCIIFTDENEDGDKIQMNSLENSFHSIVEQTTTKLSKLEGATYHQALLTFLVGIGLALRGCRLLFTSPQIIIEDSSISDNEKPTLEDEHVISFGFNLDLHKKTLESDDNSIPPDSPASSSTAVFTFSPEDIIRKRLAELGKDQNISPIIFTAAALQDKMTCSRLIQEGIKYDILGPEERTLAHVAATTGNISLFSSVCSVETMWARCSRDPGHSPLDYAVFHSHGLIVDYLTKHSTFTSFSNFEKLDVLNHAIDFAPRGYISNYLVGMREGIQREIQDMRDKDSFWNSIWRNDIKGVKRLHNRGISDESAVLTACKSGHAPMVSFLLSSSSDGFSYNIMDAIEFTAEEGKQDLLVLLLCSIQEVSARISASKTAYRKSLNAGQTKISQFLVSCGEVDVEYAFKVAGKSRNQPFMEWLLEKEDALAFYGEPINLAFHAAMFAPSVSLPLIQMLVDNGADVNSEHHVWGTALNHAAARNRLDVIQYLVDEAGADLDSATKFGGSSPIMAAVSTGNYSIFQYFLNLQPFSSLNKQYGSFGNILQTASYLGEERIVKELLDRGFDINARLEPHGSALIMAIQGGKDSIAELLISRGADVNMAIPKYGTALHLAAEAGRGEIVKLLVEAGADVNAEGGEYGTALQAAAANCHQLIALYLLDHGAEVDKRGGKYGNALKAADVGGDRLLAKLLLFSGAKVIA